MKQSERMKDALDSLLAWSRRPTGITEDLRLQRRRVAWLRKVGASELPDAERCLAELERAVVKGETQT